MGFERVSIVFICLYLVSFWRIVHSDKEVLLDRSSQDSPSDEAASQVWSDFVAVGTTGKTKHGWQSGGTRKNGYAVCDTEVEGAENWLRTPYIALDDAKILKIRIWYNQEDCSLAEEKSSKKCDNKIKLSYLHRSNASPDDKAAYKPLDQHLGDLFFTETKLEESSQDDAFLYEAEIDLERIAENNFQLGRTVSDGGIYLAFTDHGSCTVIHSIKVFYYFCPQVVKDFTLYPRTTSGGSSSPVFGSCQQGASSQPDRQPKALCNNAGGWDHMKSSQDKCQCEAGYESTNEDRIDCTPCGPHTYKSDRSSGACTRCPLNSSPDLMSGSTKCICNHGFFPPPSDFHDLACQQPPPPPEGPIAIVQNTFVTINWNDPIMDSWYSGRKFWYRIQCENCASSVHVPEELYNPKVQLTGLQEFTRYVVRIYTENTLTMFNPDSAQYATVEFKTQSRAKITNLDVKSEQDNSIYLTWASEPVSMQGGFKVISMFNNEHQSEQEVQIPQYTMRHVAPGPWKFKVCSVVQPDVCSNDLYFDVQGEISSLDLELSPKHLVITAAMIMAIILLMLVILVLAVYCYRRSTPIDSSGAMWNNSSHRSMHLLDVSPNCYSQTESTYGMKSPFGQSFVDPKFCEDPEKVLYEFTREIPLDQLEIFDSQKLSTGLENSEQYPTGHFGRAILHTLDDQRIELVTKKCDLMSVSNTTDLRSFASEAAVASQFNDPNVLMVYGVAYGPTEAYMCYEVAHKGNLLSFVRESCDKLSSIQLVHLLRGISCGMQYLSDLGYCHKVLISENIAVNSSGICKIAGFDMRTALELEDSTGSTAKIAKYLVPWSAPEVVNYKKYWSASDVYSFATVIWEVFSNGSSPHLAYPKSVSSELVDGNFQTPFMLSIPEGCPEAISELMSSCWNPDKNSRPNFRQIRETLDNIVRHPLFINQPFTNSMIYQAQQQYSTLANMTQRSQSQVPASEQMLRSLKLEKQYLSFFLTNNILDSSDLIELTEDMIGAIGVTNNKHKKKIISYIESLKKQNQSKYMVTTSTFKNSAVNMLV